MKLTKMRLLVGLGILSIVAVVGALGLTTKPKSETQETQVLSRNAFYNDTYKFGLSYADTTQSTELSDDDVKSNILLRLQQSFGPSFLVTIRSESGLRLPSSMARLDTLDLVVNGALGANRTRYNEYSLESDGAVKLGSREAYEIIFTYKSPSGIRAKQKLILFSPNSDSAVYISMQAEETVFDSVNQNVFDDIVQSITF